MVAYKNSLVLFGGYSLPYEQSINQQVNFYDELHVFYIDSLTWYLKIFPLEVPKRLAGHTASIINNDQMIVFGGCDSSLLNKTNQVHCLCLKKYEWLNREIIGVHKPDVRYGHSQASIDNERVLIVGGCGGPNTLYDDIWLLLWPTNSLQATWQKLTVKQNVHAPLQLNCIDLVKCEDKLITLGNYFNDSSRVSYLIYQILLDLQ
jgi:F-box protein 42